MTLRDVFRILWHRYMVLIAAAMIAVGIGGLLVVAQGVQYEARTRVLMSESAVLAPGDVGLLTQQKLNLLSFSYATLVSSPAFVDASLHAKGISASGVSVTSTVVPNTSVFEVVVHAKSADRANSAASALSAAIRAEIERPPASPGVPISTHVLEDPTAHRSTAAPLFVVIASLIVGLAIGAIVALLLEPS